MNRKLLTLVLLLLFSSSLIGAEPDDKTKFVLRVNVEKIRQVNSFQLLFESAKQIPYIAEQLDTIPKSLDFLKDAKLRSLSVVYAEGITSEPIVEVVGDIDLAEMTNLISHGRGYAKVQYQNVDIHHWIADLDQLSEQFMGQTSMPNELSSSEDSFFLAILSENRILVTGNLADLTYAIDRKESAGSLINESEIVKYFGVGEDLVVYQANAPKGTFPGEMSAVIREEASGRLRVQAAIKSRDESERMVANMVYGMLTDIDAITQMVNSELVGPKGEQVEKAELGIETTDEGDSETAEHNNRVSIGFKLDSNDFDYTEVDKMIQRFFDRCVQCEYADDVLVLDIGFFVGPWQVTNIAKDSETGKAAGLKYNVLSVIGHMYSSAENQKAAIRVAELKASEGTQRK